MRGEKEYEFPFRIPKYGIADSQIVWGSSKTKAKKVALAVMLDAFHDRGFKITRKDIKFVASKRKKRKSKRKK